MKTLEIDASVKEKIVSMVLYEVPLNQICLATGLKEEVIVAFTETDEFKGNVATQSFERFENADLLNKGWDDIEAQGILQVGTALKYNKDPEFALKAATLANRAQRKSGMKRDSNHIPAQLGARVVVELPSIYLQQNNIHIQNSGNVIDKLLTQAGGPNNKLNDVMTPRRVQAILEGRTEEELAHQEESRFEKVMVSDDA